MKTILHLIYRFDIGGLEKVMADTINHTPDYKHVIVCLTEATSESKKLLHSSLQVIELNKKPGNDLSIWKKLFSQFFSIKPHVLHTYNLPTLEYQLLGFIFRIPIRIHAEHGRDASDPNGTNPKYRILRQLLNPFIHSWVAVSKDLSDWLIHSVNIPPKKVQLIHNGIHTEEYKKNKSQAKATALEGFATNDDFIVGTIGRIDPVKNQKILIEIYKQLIKVDNTLSQKIKFVIIGSGPLLKTLQENITSNNLNHIFWSPGPRYDINRLMNSFDVFVLPSIAEGIPMTVLEAMATEKPVIASRVGGLPEIIDDRNGYLLEPNDVNSWAETIFSLFNSATKINEIGLLARQTVEKKFSLASMILQYSKLYSRK